MHSWFTQKLNEMTGLAHYCQYPVLKAHFILAQKAVDEIYDKPAHNGVGLAQLLPLLASEAENDGHFEVAGHLRNAMNALNADQEKVLAVDFRTPRNLGVARLEENAS
ncbi:hypothetical protein [Cognatishimia activa]|uniref:Uncharacterized protein n=1 Tax=Cognatishimia activa TaxID=1715691 RepID=A0A0P1ISJ6_9RHOB|nr:hypothetical protein [Cognatishimia activa]CUI65374.1 hypothetical protein TA5113_01055 [Cognatishimia activa]CUK26418.1 hypothetical protein TA5114_02228 [Cognatishimia activa]